jgi:hypothetical protein
MYGWTPDTPLEALVLEEQLTHTLRQLMSRCT